jgi:hypothetical protein
MANELTDKIRSFTPLELIDGAMAGLAEVRKQWAETKGPADPKLLTNWEDGWGYALKAVSELPTGKGISWADIP